VLNYFYFTMTFAERLEAVVVGDPDRTHCRVDVNDGDSVDAAPVDALLPELLKQDYPNAARSTRR
jgi:hypothetical protein